MSDDSTLTIVAVYPAVLGTYGDAGNAAVLCARAKQRGYNVRMTVVEPFAPVPDSGDIYLLGGSDDAAQSGAVEAMREHGGLGRALASGASVFAVCAGFQLLGESFPAGDRQVPGLGLLDADSHRLPTRAVGELLTHPADAVKLPELTGYENHASGTTLGPDASPLASVELGIGNGNGADGARQGRITATYLHGPALARNIGLVDHVLEQVVGPLPGDAPPRPSPTGSGPSGSMPRGPWRTGRVVRSRSCSNSSPAAPGNGARDAGDRRGGRRRVRAARRVRGCRCHARRRQVGCGRRVVPLTNCTRDTAAQTAARLPATPRPAATERLSIPSIGVHGLRVVAYTGHADDRPGTKIEDHGLAASPRGPRGGVGPGEVGNLIITAHRTSAGGPLLRLPSLRDRAHILISSAGLVYDYVVTATMTISFRSAASLARQSAAVPGHPGSPPTRAMITLSTCATLEDHARGNYWSDALGNPEHRIDKVGVLVAVRSG